MKLANGGNSDVLCTGFRLRFVFASGLLLTILGGCAEMSVRPAESPMDALARMTDRRTRCVSAENPTGEPGGDGRAERRHIPVLV